MQSQNSLKLKRLSKEKQMKQPKPAKPITAVKKTSRPGIANKPMPKLGGPAAEKKFTKPPRDLNPKKIK